MATFRPNKRSMQILDAIAREHPECWKDKTGKIYNVSHAIRIALEDWWKANQMEKEVNSVHDFDKGFGIGGLGRHVEEPVIPDSPEPVPGAHFAPTGTTEGQVTEEVGACEVCGAPTRNWNPGAGAYLCPRHWDNY